MAVFVVAKRKRRPDGWQAIIRRKGQRPLKRTFDTKTQARIWAAEQESLILAKRFRDPRLADMVTLQEALEKYQEQGRTVEKKAETTLDRERYCRRKLEGWFGPKTPLGKITPRMVADYQNSRLKDKGSHSSIRQELSMLSKMYEIARREWQLPVANPVADIRRVPPKRGRERFLSEKEAALVVATAKKMHNKKFYPYVLLLLHSGMRSGEAARLRPGDIDFDRRIIAVRKTKSGRPRHVPLTTTVAEVLREVEPYPSGYLFLQQHHLQSRNIILRPGSVFRDCWKYLVKRLARQHQEDPETYPEVPHFTVHDLRHTAGSHLLKNGVDIRIIADILGHSTLQMVLRYTHPDDDSRVQSIETISRLGEEL